MPRLPPALTGMYGFHTGLPTYLLPLLTVLPCLHGTATTTHARCVRYLPGHGFNYHTHTHTTRVYAGLTATTCLHYRLLDYPTPPHLRFIYGYRAPTWVTYTTLPPRHIPLRYGYTLLPRLTARLRGLHAHYTPAFTARRCLPPCRRLRAYAPRLRLRLYATHVCLPAPARCAPHRLGYAIRCTHCCAHAHAVPVRMWIRYAPFYRLPCSHGFLRCAFFLPRAAASPCRRAPPLPTASLQRLHPAHCTLRHAARRAVRAPCQPAVHFPTTCLLYGLPTTCLTCYTVTCPTLVVTQYCSTFNASYPVHWFAGLPGSLRTNVPARLAPVCPLAVGFPCVRCAQFTFSLHRHYTYTCRDCLRVHCRAFALPRTRLPACPFCCAFTRTATCWDVRPAAGLAGYLSRRAVYRTHTHAPATTHTLPHTPRVTVLHHLPVGPTTAFTFTFTTHTQRFLHARATFCSPIFTTLGWVTVSSATPATHHLPPLHTYTLFAPSLWTC